jgi:hypothetical protein
VFQTTPLSSSLLLSIWDKKASDSQDKVFAVLGLYNGTQMIKTDYRLSIRDVFVQAAKACISEEGNLDALNYAGQVVINGSPEWVSYTGGNGGALSHSKDLIRTPQKVQDHWMATGACHHGFRIGTNHSHPVFQSCVPQYSSSRTCPTSPQTSVSV